MAHLKAVASFGYSTNLPKDVSQNTFHFNCATDPALGAIAVAERIQEFIHDVPTTGTTRPDSYLANIIAPLRSKILVYNMDEPSPRPPLLEAPMTLTIGSGTGLPTEVALCLSFQGVKVPGTPQARRRGRIYWGPLMSATMEAVANEARPTSGVRNTLGLAGKDLAGKNDADLAWCVYSVTTGDLVPVHDGWVDNAFDTQRRRGSQVTTRNVWSV